jgi:hypothetical protein
VRLFRRRPSHEAAAAGRGGASEAAGGTAGVAGASEAATHGKAGRPEADAAANAGEAAVPTDSIALAGVAPYPACSQCGRTDLPLVGGWDPPICLECDAQINEDAMQAEETER